MKLQDIIAADAAIFTSPDDFGVAVVYCPQGGEPKTINAIVEIEFSDVEFPTAANLKYHNRYIFVSVADVPAPMKLALDGGTGDSFQIGRVVWYLVDVVENGVNAGDSMHKLLLRNAKIPLR